LSENRIPEAADVYQQVVSEGGSSLGMDHPHMMFIVPQTIRVLRQMRADEDAAFLEAEYRRACEQVAQRHAEAPSALRDRALARVEIGQYRQASDDLNCLIALDPTLFEGWYLRGALLAFLNRQPDYHDHCARMLKLFRQTTNPEIAADLARLSLAMPRKLGECDAIEPLVALAESGPGGKYGLTKMIRGMLVYRAGDDYEQAAQLLNGAREDRADWPAFLAVTDLMLAMSHHRCNRPEKARAAYTDAMRMIKSSVPAPGSQTSLAPIRNRLICHAILREARALLGEENLPDGEGGRPTE
jgi:tetratricopeptide (TPR) repeat protein